MHTGRFVFSELIAHLPHQEFQKCVARYDDHPQPRKLSYWDQYLAMAFAQLTYRESLRDIEACLRSVTGKLYHLGFRGTVARSTLADANETRDWRHLPPPALPQKARRPAYPVRRLIGHNPSHPNLSRPFNHLQPLYPRSQNRPFHNRIDRLDLRSRIADPNLRLPSQTMLHKDPFHGYRRANPAPIAKMPRKVPDLARGLGQAKTIPAATVLGLQPRRRTTQIVHQAHPLLRRPPAARVLPRAPWDLYMCKINAAARQPRPRLLSSLAGNWLRHFCKFK